MSNALHNPQGRNSGSSGRLAVIILTFLYVVALLVTVAFLVLVDVPGSRAGHIWITTLALTIGETFLYGTAVHYQLSLPGSRRLIPSYMGMGTAALLYLLVALALAVVFSWVLDIPTFLYGLLQFIALGIAAFLMGLLVLYRMNAARQEEGT
ncbi:hypothetical protein [Cohnella sp. AR92]|uniref:hypothetical protein n=1 Tax=Cohnella sp. AR92 TaxID=648716 RepID=UPI000F8C4546|nr:hypothetical protein [Cohnella sp. AR92]RUS48991.1 hypothetical protein ELR57_01195 [Cohnella sp. AR92]